MLSFVEDVHYDQPEKDDGQGATALEDEMSEREDRFVDCEPWQTHVRMMRELSEDNQLLFCVVAGKNFSLGAAHCWPVHHIGSFFLTDLVVDVALILVSLDYQMSLFQCKYFLFLHFSKPFISYPFCLQFCV